MSASPTSSLHKQLALLDQSLAEANAGHQSDEGMIKRSGQPPVRKNKHNLTIETRPGKKQKSPSPVNDLFDRFLEHKSPNTPKKISKAQQHRLQREAEAAQEAEATSQKASQIAIALRPKHREKPKKTCVIS